MVIMEENQGASSVFGSTSALYLNKTIGKQYPALTHNFATGHPSLPNYLAITGGSTNGVSSDCDPTSTCTGVTPNLFTELDKAGVRWMEWAEGMPSCGYTGGDVNFPGTTTLDYSAHHNPSAYYGLSRSELNANECPLPGGSTSTTTTPNLNGSAVTAALNASNAADFYFVTPNVLDDGHNGGIVTTDNWASRFIPAVMASNWYKHGGNIIIEYDEGEATGNTDGVGSQASGGGGQIAGWVISASDQGQTSYSTPVNQDGILGSIESLYGVPRLNDAANHANGNISSLLSGGQWNSHH